MLESLSDLDLASVDYVLRTTRSVRKRLDMSRPVPPELISECVEIALQAPSGCNLQLWRFIVVTDAEKRRRLGELYAAGAQAALEGKTGIDRIGMSAAREFSPGDARTERRDAVWDSGGYLHAHMAEAPVLVVPCHEGRPGGEDTFTNATFYGSILPAAWSFMLALRSRGLVSAWTTLHLLYEQEAAELLGIPDDVTQAGLLPVAYPVGEHFLPGRRVPAADVISWNSW